MLRNFLRATNRIHVIRTKYTLAYRADDGTLVEAKLDKNVPLRRPRGQTASGKSCQDRKNFIQPRKLKMGFLHVLHVPDLHKL